MRDAACAVHTPGAGLQLMSVNAVTLAYPELWLSLLPLVGNCILMFLSLSLPAHTWPAHHAVLIRHCRWQTAMLTCSMTRPTVSPGGPAAPTCRSVVCCVVVPRGRHSTQQQGNRYFSARPGQCCLSPPPRRVPSQAPPPPPSTHTHTHTTAEHQQHVVVQVMGPGCFALPQQLQPEGLTVARFHSTCHGHMGRLVDGCVLAVQHPAVASNTQPNP